MKKIVSKFIFILIYLLISGSNNTVLYASIGGKDVIIKAAEKELIETLNKIPIGNENLYGFNNRDEFKKAFLGEIFRMYIINSTTEDGGIGLISTEEYRIPVIVGTEYRALITVSRIDEGWHIVDFGATALAKELETFHGSFFSEPNTEGVFLRIYGINCDFISSKKTGESIELCKFYPLNSAKNIIENYNFQKNEKYELSLIFDLIDRLNN